MLVHEWLILMVLNHFNDGGSWLVLFKRWLNFCFMARIGEIMINVTSSGVA